MVEGEISYFCFLLPIIGGNTLLCAWDQSLNFRFFFLLFSYLANFVARFFNIIPSGTPYDELDKKNKV